MAFIWGRRLQIERGRTLAAVPANAWTNERLDEYRVICIFLRFGVAFRNY
jgi:hypothetical protein